MDSSFLFATTIIRLVIVGFALITMVPAVNLYVASYSGNITSLSLDQTEKSEYVLSTLSSVASAAPQPSWLEKKGNLVYAVNENFNGPNGTLVSYKTSATGTLTPIQQPQLTPAGPVSIAVYNQGKALAIAHYGGSAVSNYEISSGGSVSHLQSFFYKTPPGPIPQQDNSHPHQAILDPSEEFIVVPDLGSDLIRVFSFDETSHLTEQKSFSLPPGSGPRHGAFLQVEQDASQKTYFFLINELANTVASYAVSRTDTSLNFTLISTNNVLNQASPPGLASAELTLSPDKKFVHTSARNATLFTIPNPSDSKNGSIPSDTLQTWKIDTSTGALSFQQLAPAGGRTPRHFSLNKNGTLAAVALQGDGRIVIFERSLDTGAFGKIIASTNVEGQVTNVIWDE